MSYDSTISFVPDATYDIGVQPSSVAGARPMNIYAAGMITAPAGIRLGVTGQTNGPMLFAFSGLPSASWGSNGDYYFRQDTPGTVNQRIYVKSAGAWVGIV
jgi:hypothetical protein